MSCKKSFFVVQVDIADCGEDVGYVRENKLQLISVHYIDSSKAPINKMFKVFDKSTVEKVKSIIASHRGHGKTKFVEKGTAGKNNKYIK